MNISFAGKKIVVTGGGEGIGKAILQKLIQCQGSVLAIDSSKILLDSLKKEIPAVEIAEIDLSDWDTTRKSLRNLDGIDFLVNNAGVITLEPFLRVKPESFDRVFSVNVKALFNVSQVIARKMVESKKGGAIVNMTTHASKLGFQDQAVLCASRGAVDALTRNMAIELGPYNIRVNSINPTVIMTGLGKIAFNDPTQDHPITARIPLGRLAGVEEAVNATLFFLSDKASFITGVSLPIDGGMAAALKIH